MIRILILILALFGAITAAIAQQPSSGDVRIGQPSGLPAWKPLSGSCTLNANGTIGCPFTGIAPTPTSPGDIILWNGSQWGIFWGNYVGTAFLSQTAGVPAWLPAAGTGTVTSITCGAGLNGGTITSSGTCSIANPGRILLSAATTFYVSTTGSDVTGDGSSGSPWATRTHAYATLESQYDLGGQAVTVNLAAGTYSDLLQIIGPIVGQNGPITFTGNCASGHTQDVIIAPAFNAGYAYSVVGSRSSIRIQCQRLDQINNLNSPTQDSDILVVGNRATAYIGNPSMFASFLGADITYGCNLYPYNDNTLLNFGYLEFDNDFQVDVTGAGCSISQTGTATLNSNVITGVTSTADILPYMSITGNSNVPVDAFVAAGGVGSNTVTFSCIRTTPCQASGNGSATIVYEGGGQDFIDIASNSTAYFSTNGNPGNSIINTILGYPMRTAGWANLADTSSLNAQAITFVGGGDVPGACPEVAGLSVINTGRQAPPYLPCHRYGPVATASSVSLTAGHTSFTVGATTGTIVPGMLVTDIAVANGTWTQGQANISIPSTQLSIGASIIAPGILAGAHISGVNGNPATLVGVGTCNPNGRCVGGYPTYMAEVSTPVIFAGSLIYGGAIVTGVNGSVITIDRPILNSGTGNLWFTGAFMTGSQYH